MKHYYYYYFTSVKFIDILKYAAVGICIKSRTNMPKLNLESALEKSDSVFRRMEREFYVFNGKIRKM